MPLSFSKLQDAFLFISGDPSSGESQAFIDRQSGEIHYRSGFDSSLDEEELPDDIDDADKYIAVPDKRELDLGTHLVFDFVRHHLPDDYDEVRQIFGRKGAYGRFKSLLARRNAIDRWHDFSNKAEEAALKAWCADNAIDLVD
jgi:hypothetical protein